MEKLLLERPLIARTALNFREAMAADEIERLPWPATGN
jgi:hypothetical protein